MRRPSAVRCHGLCPEKRIPEFTGNFGIDSNILKSKNRTLADRLDLYTSNKNPFKPRTGYNGYHHYSGDD